MLVFQLTYLKFFISEVFVGFRFVPSKQSSHLLSFHISKDPPSLFDKTFTPYFCISYSHFIDYHICLSCKLTAASSSPSIYVSSYKIVSKITPVYLSNKYSYLMLRKWYWQCLLHISKTVLYSKLIWLRVYCFYDSIISPENENVSVDTFWLTLETEKFAGKLLAAIVVLSWTYWTAV